MPLNSFGAILSFAEELEIKKNNFYRAALQKSVDSKVKAIFETLATEGEKHIKLIRRSRQENVTEMILEPVNDFFREPFNIDETLSDSNGLDQIVQTAKTNEEISLNFYSEASLKLKTLTEVARILKQLAKKHKARLEKLNRF